MVRTDRDLNKMQEITRVSKQTPVKVQGIDRLRCLDVLHWLAQANRMATLP